MKGSRTNYYSGFDPRSIDGCALWLDAADRTSLTLSGSNVTAWNDKSGQGINFTAAGAGTAPVLSNYNGRPALAWTATNQQMTSISNNPTPGSAARSIFFVTHNPLSTSKIYAVTGTETGANPAIAWGYAKNANADYTYPFLYSSIGADIFTTVQITNTPTILTTTFDGTSNLNGWINGQYQITKTTGINTATTPWYLGLRPSGVGSLDSLLLEFLIYNVSFTTAQRQQVEGYLARKWGIQTNIPATHPYKSIPPALRPFAPVDVPGCSLWLDAADSATVTLSGSNVTSWRDKSGNNNNSTSASAVTYSANSVNGLSAITFGPGGLNNGSIIVGSISPSNTGTQVTAFIVATMKSESYIYNRFLSLGSSGGNDYQTVSNIQLFGRGESLNIATFYNNTGIGSTIPAYDTPFQAFSSRDSSTLSFGVNGSTPATAASGTTGNFLINFYAIGASLTSQTGLSGKICEIVVYNSRLSSNQRQQIEGYLARKWGLQPALPNPHPYRYVPTIGFLPTSLSNCALWLDASDSSTLTLSGSNVTQWNDKSGNGRNATVFWNAPTFSNSAVWFTSTQGLQTSLSASSDSESGFVVARASQQTTGNTLLGGANMNNTRQFRIPNVISTLRQDIAGILFTGTTLPVNTTHLVEFVRNGSSLAHYWNGNDYASTTGATTAYSAGGTTSIGQRFGNFASEGLIGNIQEIVVYSSPLSTAQRQQVEGYLAWKWGLQRSLPSGHPYLGGLPALTAGFTPVAISGCSLWLDAADATTVTRSGSNVTAWNDKSGNGYNATVNSTAYATFSNAGLYFSNSYYNTSYPANPSNETLFVVFNKPVLGDNITNTLIGSQTGGREIGIGTTTVAQFAVMNAGTAFGSITASNTIVANTKMIGVSQITAGSTQVQLNGGTFASAVSLSFTAGKTTDLGRENGTSFGYVGFAHEIIFYNTSLTTAQRQQVEGYLANKWGLVSSLPSNHPYRLIKP